MVDDGKPLWPSVIRCFAYGGRSKKDLQRPKRSSNIVLLTHKTGFIAHGNDI